MTSNGKKLVLITGGSGFIAAWCIVKCLAANYHVRTTVRSLKRESNVREMLAAADATNLNDLSFIEADLTKDAGWNEATKGCTFVLHVASPFPAAAPKHEDDLIIPARDGTLRVLRASRDAGVKRVVVTSSFAAIHGGQTNFDTSRLFTENDWSKVDGPNIDAYGKSKTLAERAAWDFIDKEGGDLEMAVVNPVSVLGPVLCSDISSSVQIVLRLMNGSVPGCPRLTFSVVDVRDVADMHLLAMTNPRAKGERFICDSPPAMSMKAISLALRERMGKAARRCPTISLPDILLKVMALFDPAIALVVPRLGEVHNSSIEKAKNLLGWEPRSNVDAVVATAESLIKLGIIKS
jgi:nucleoside-diphosphate-sugar epimerase